jgi:hypothetical protein
VRKRLGARAEDRLQIACESEIDFLGSGMPATLLNLSTLGACGLAADPPPVGGICTIRLGRMGPVHAQIRWARDGRFGCRFVEPLSLTAVMLEYLDTGALERRAEAVPAG